MQTDFSLAQLADPATARSESIIRRCVHCGFCTATCPTYVTLGNELDSPRGRIYLIKEMLENDRPADETTVKHIDRCLSCLACMTTCPSGVHYMHLVDHARVHIEETYRRPLAQRAMRELLAFVLPHRGRFRASLHLAKLGRPFAPLFRAVTPLKPLAAMLDLAPARIAPKSEHTTPGRSFPPQGERRGRVAILTGCAQPVLDEAINGHTIALLNRLGVEVVLPAGEGCCGSLVHHMGRDGEAHAQAKRNIVAWEGEMAEHGGAGLDAILVTTSGCGTTIKDYGHMLRTEPQWAERAAAISALALDVSEYLATLPMPEPSNKGGNGAGLVVAYHAACSLQHGQKVTVQPKALLRQAGFVVRDVPEAHLCCGSAGTYNILQPEIAGELQARKVRNLESVRPQAIAAGNIGCLTQIGAATGVPVLHTIKLLDWAYGGEKPRELEGVEPAAEPAWLAPAG